MAEFDMEFDSGLQIQEEKPAVASEQLPKSAPEVPTKQFTIFDNIEIILRNFNNKNAMIYISQFSSDGSQKFGSIIQARVESEQLEDMMFAGNIDLETTSDDDESKLSASILMGDRAMKDCLEFFTQNLLNELRKKMPGIEGLVATVSVEKMSSKNKMERKDQIMYAKKVIQEII